MEPLVKEISRYYGKVDLFSCCPIHQKICAFFYFSGKVIPEMDITTV
jgi:hypothetical protein